MNQPNALTAYIATYRSPQVTSQGDDQMTVTDAGMHRGLFWRVEKNRWESDADVILISEHW